MSDTAIFINLLACACLVLSLLKDKGKTARALMIAVRAFWRLLPTILFILLIVALIMGFVKPQWISQWLGHGQKVSNVFIAALMGAILHIPSIVSFPLAASLLQKGASIIAIATFITTLTMIGFVTLPLEIKALGKRFAFWRNGMSLLIAIIIGLLIGVIQ